MWPLFSCAFPLSSTLLAHAGSFSCSHAPTLHGLYPIFLLSFLVATLSHTFAFLLAFLSMSSLCHTLAHFPALDLFGALPLSCFHSFPFPGSSATLAISHVLTLHFTHSSASSCTHTLSIPLCSLFLRKTLLLIQNLYLMLSFLSSPTLIHGSSHTFCLSLLLPHLFLSLLQLLPVLCAGSSLCTHFFLCSSSQQSCFPMCSTCMHSLPHALIILHAHPTPCALTLSHGPAFFSAHLLFLMCPPFLTPLSSILLTQDFSFLLEPFLTFFLFHVLILTCSPLCSFSLSLCFTSYLFPLSSLSYPCPFPHFFPSLLLYSFDVSFSSPPLLSPFTVPCSIFSLPF